MKKLLLLSFVLLALILSSFKVHKFYVSIYQIEYASDKKMLQITSRIFIDDLNSALQQKYGKKTYFGEKEESADDVAAMKKYLSENFSMSINGRQEQIEYLSREYESNVIICYFRIKNIAKIKTIAIRNSVLTDYVTEQQNIIQTTIYGKKKSFVLTAEHHSDKLDF